MKRSPEELGWEGVPVSSALWSPSGPLRLALAQTLPQFTEGIKGLSWHCLHLGKVAEHQPGDPCLTPSSASVWPSGCCCPRVCSPLWGWCSLGRALPHSALSPFLSALPFSSSRRSLAFDIFLSSQPHKCRLGTCASHPPLCRFHAHPPPLTVYSPH